MSSLYCSPPLTLRHNEPLLCGHTKTSSSVPHSFNSDLSLSRQLTSYTQTSSYNINSKIPACSNPSLRRSQTHRGELHSSQGLPRSSAPVSAWCIAFQSHRGTSAIVTHSNKPQSRNNLFCSFPQHRNMTISPSRLPSPRSGEQSPNITNYKLYCRNKVG